LCGDGSDPRAARGYFMPKKKGEGLYFFCHRCNEGKSFSRLLEGFDSTLYQEYRGERLQSKYSGSRHTLPATIHQPMFDNARLITAREKTSITDHLMNMAEMPNEWSRYLLNRKIPKDILWNYFYFTQDFNGFANIVRPRTFSIKACAYKESRIVITMPDYSGKIQAIQGRETQKSYAKYITVKASEESRKIFGLDRMNNAKPVYVFEGPIDSCFVDNGIGVCGADLVSQVVGLKIDPVFCFDNEPRSRIIVGKISSAISSGEKVVIFPANISGKDINDMSLSGIQVNELVRSRTFSGLRAQMELNKWKRI